MKRRSARPVALTIAGSDSGGGAGIQADLKTWSSLGVHGTCAITCVTAQNPGGVTGIQAVRADLVRRQIEAVFAELPPAVCKTGMLFSSELIGVVAGLFKRGEPPPLIVDPVMVATSGVRLLKSSAIKALQDDLLPLAALVTPNLDEAELLLEMRIVDEEGLRTAARRLHSQFGCAALVKGGHLPRTRQAVDIFYDGETELLLSAPRVPGRSTHGTGCTYSAAIAGYSALGCSLVEAVTQAKEFITQAIAQSVRVGRHSVLNYSPKRI